MRRVAALLLLAACLLAAGGARGDGGVGEDGAGEAAGGPQPVAQLTLTMTDGSGKQSPVVAMVMAEEDAAAAAVRFCFDKGLLQPRQVLDITGYLKSVLEGKEHEPDGIELLRTAGAYSRRAAESSKEESYAEAAAGVPPPRRSGAPASRRLLSRPAPCAVHLLLLVSQGMCARRPGARARPPGARPAGQGED